MRQWDRDGSWFVRIHSRCNYQVRPVAPAGWILTVGYPLGIVATSILLLRNAPGTAQWAAWGVLCVGLTLLFVLIVIQTSRPASPGETFPRGRGRKRS